MSITSSNQSPSSPDMRHIVCVALAPACSTFLVIFYFTWRLQGVVNHSTLARTDHKTFSLILIPVIWWFRPSRTKHHFSLCCQRLGNILDPQGNIIDCYYVCWWSAAWTEIKKNCHDEREVFYTNIMASSWQLITCHSPYSRSGCQIPLDEHDVLTMIPVAVYTNPWSQWGWCVFFEVQMQAGCGISRFGQGSIISNAIWDVQHHRLLWLLASKEFKSSTVGFVQMSCVSHSSLLNPPSDNS